MCCFSRPVAFVGATRIFARPAGGDRQHLAYAMRVGSREPVAMVLPLPVPPGPSEDAVSFVDLSDYPGLFADLERGFEPALAAPSRGLPGGGGAPQRLVVHEVGAFVASFAPTLADLDRLDPRFRLPRRVWDAVPEVRDYGFVVFQLRGFGRGGLLRRLRLLPAPRRDFHPMAFTFPRRDAGSLTFPTLHVHDGEVHPTAHFDHTLFLQAGPGVDGPPGWEQAPGPAAGHVRIEAARGLVDGATPCFRRVLAGELPNGDQRVAV